MNVDTSPVRYVYTVGHALVWLGVLVFLFSDARSERWFLARRAVAPQPSSAA